MKNGSTLLMDQLQRRESLGIKKREGRLAEEKASMEVLDTFAYTSAVAVGGGGGAHPESSICEIPRGKGPPYDSSRVPRRKAE